MTDYEKVKYCNEHLDNHMVDVDDDPKQIDYTYTMAHDYGLNWFEIDDLAWLNTLAGYDIGYRNVSKLRVAYDDLTDDPSLIGLHAKDKDLVKEIAKKCGMTIDFSRWAKEEPEAMNYDWWKRSDDIDMSKNIKFRVKINDTCLNILRKGRGTKEEYEKVGDYTIANIQYKDLISIDLKMWNFDNVEFYGRIPNLSYDIFVNTYVSGNERHWIGEDDSVFRPEIDWNADNWEELLHAQMGGVLLAEAAKRNIDKEELVKVWVYGDTVTETYLGIKPPTETFEKIFGSNAVEISVPKSKLSDWFADKLSDDGWKYSKFSEFIEECTAEDLDGFVKWSGLTAKEIGAEDFLQKFLDGAKEIVKAEGRLY